jgi:hypothetical protein
MSEYYDPDDKKLNRNVPKALAAEVVALQDQLSAKLREVRAARLAGLKAMPKCPESGCGVEVYRPKCPWEYGGGCPRHDVCTAYGGMTALGRKFGLLPEKPAENR